MVLEGEPVFGVLSLPVAEDGPVGCVLFRTDFEQDSL